MQTKRIAVFGFALMIAALSACGSAPDPAVSGEVDVAVAALGNPPCWGSSCNGVNPQTSGCATNGIVDIMDSAEIKNGSTVVGGVELKYSRWCNARWAKVYSYIGLKCIGAIVRHKSNTYDIAGTGWYDCGQSDGYGNMYGGDIARGKGYIYTPSGYREGITDPAM